MSGKRELKDGGIDARYEFRVWGEHPKALKKLEEMAPKETLEKVKDCYLLIDDPDLNAKVRKSAIKVKQLLSVERGFERWSTEWHHDADSAPTPLDVVFEDLDLAGAQHQKRFDLDKAVEEMDEDSDARVVFVTKRRRHFRIGSIRAEVTRLRIRGRKSPLHTFAIEGNDLDALDALRRELGFDRRDNQATHVKLEKEAS